MVCFFSRLRMAEEMIVNDRGEDCFAWCHLVKQILSPASEVNNEQQGKS